MVAGVAGEVRGEIVRDLALALHPQQCFGPAGVAATLISHRALEDGDAAASLQGRRSGREAGDAAADHDDVEGA